MSDNLPSAASAEHASPAASEPVVSAPIAPAPPPAVVAPSPDAAQKPSIQQAIAGVDFSQMTGEQLEALGSGDQAKIDAALGVQRAPKQVVETPAPDEDDDEQPAAAVAGKKSFNGVSLKALTSTEERIAIAQAVGLVRDGVFGTFKEAYAHTTGGDPATAAPGAAPVEGDTPPAAAAPAVPTVAPAVQAITDQITALEADYEQALSVEFDYAKAGKIHRQISKLETDKVRAEMKAEAEGTVEQKWQSDQVQSRDRALATYADLIKSPDSEFLDFVRFEEMLAEQKNDPILHSPDWPEKISQRVYEKRYGGKSVGQTAGAEVTTTQQIPPVPARVRLPGSPIGPATTSGAVTAATAMATFDTLSFEEKAEVLEALDAKGR